MPKLAVRNMEKLLDHMHWECVMNEAKFNYWLVQKKKLAIMNIWFAVHPRRRYTWSSHIDQARNQIDYMMINERYRFSTSDARACPRADADSDHNPATANIKIYLRVLKL